MGWDMPSPKMPLSLRGCGHTGQHLTHGSMGPAESNSNDISIGSAVFLIIIIIITTTINVFVQRHKVVTS